MGHGGTLVVVGRPASQPAGPTSRPAGRQTRTTATTTSGCRAGAGAKRPRPTRAKATSRGATSGRPRKRRSGCRSLPGRREEGVSVATQRTSSMNLGTARPGRRPRANQPSEGWPVGEAEAGWLAWRQLAPTGRWLHLMAAPAAAHLAPPDRAQIRPAPAAKARAPQAGGRRTMSPRNGRAEAGPFAFQKSPSEGA